MRLNLLDRVHRHRYHDQHRGAAKIERDLQLAAQDLGQQADRREVTRAQNQHAGHHIFQIFGGFLAGAHTGHKAVLVFQVVGHIVRFERHVVGVEIREEDDHQREEQQVSRLARAEIGQDRRHDRAGLVPREGADRHRQKQQRAGKDRRDHACGVDLDRQVA